jgi:omega-6 fatty acid desaturase (delta-12 desaturase)
MLMRRGTELVGVTKKFAKEHRWRSWWHLWSTLTVLIGLLSVTFLDMHWLLRAPWSILAGLVLVRMFIIYHDYQHGTILQGSRLSDGLMVAYGLLTLNPPSVWNRSHNHHHKNNTKILGAGIGSYPIMTTDSYAKASWKERFKYAVARHPLTMLLGYFTMFLYGMCLRPLVVNPRQHFDAGIYLIVHLGLVTVLAIFAPGMLVLAFLVPLMIACAIGAYLFYAQHNFPDVKIKSGGDWNYLFAALHSSSYITMSPVMHWFTGNIGYHHVHHLNAHIPFYRLPEAMAAMEELQSPGTTSLTPLTIYGCLRLKLWNPRKHRMVSFKGT